MWIVLLVVALFAGVGLMLAQVVRLEGLEARGGQATGDNPTRGSMDNGTPATPPRE